LNKAPREAPTFGRGVSLNFQVEHPTSMTQKELFSIWAREADAALKAKEAGAIVDLWKCVGERRVVAVVNVDGPDTLDQVLMDLPIMKEHGQLPQTLRSVWLSEPGRSV